MNKKISPWALVLSGGGARGLAHVGVLKGLEDAGFPRPSLVAGTSMGAIVGGLYACGMPPREMERFILDFNITDYLDSFAFKINGPVGKVFQTGQVLASLATNTGIDTGHRLLELFEKLTGGKSFDETEIPFRCNAVDLLKGREVIYSTGSVARAIRASMSFPLLFEPFMDQGMYLVDGGLWDNMPVTIARKEGYRRILAIDVNYFNVQETRDLKNGPQIIYRSIECALNAMSDDRAKANLVLYASDQTAPFSFLRQKELIALGERTITENMKALETFFRSRFSRFKKSSIVRKIEDDNKNES